jgi:RNA polymerase sigma-70 factor (ECF subfamily)
MNFNDNSILIQNLKKGNEEAYLYLLKTYKRKLYAYALTLIGDPTSAEDILQNVFLRTWQHRHRLNEKFTIQSFLYKSVYNEFINQHKYNKTLSVLEKKYTETLEQVVLNTHEKNLDQTILKVTQEIEKLPKKCKQVFKLSKKEGLSNIEIADYLNISTKTVEGQITKAFKFLRINLGVKVKNIIFLVYKFKKQIVSPL